MEWYKKSQQGKIEKGILKWFLRCGMPDFSGIGKILLITGLIIAGIGCFILFAGKIPWIGRLPGDFYYKGKNFTCYFPLATSIVISIIITVILMFIGRK